MEGSEQDWPWTSHFHQEGPGPFRTEVPNPGQGWEGRPLAAELATSTDS